MNPRDLLEAITHDANAALLWTTTRAYRERPVQGVDAKGAPTLSQRLIARTGADVYTFTTLITDAGISPFVDFRLARESIGFGLRGRGADVEHYATQGNEVRPLHRGCTMYGPIEEAAIPFITETLRLPTGMKPAQSLSTPHYLLT